MSKRRVLAVGLDGYEISFAEKLMSEGLLPNLRRLRAQSARFLLDHGNDKFSGLAWEHVSTGRAPSTGARSSSVTFQPSCYAVYQEPTTSTPFLAGLAARTVVFDPPYCELKRAPRVRGITNWGAHDPGVSRQSRPAELLEEMARRFGPYPAAAHIYGFYWQWPEKARVAAEDLERAVRVRAEAARWLLSERLPDWDLGLVVVGEPHSAVEPMWHGIDPDHPLHGLPSAAICREGLRRLYAAIDDLLGTLQATFPDATVAVFAVHGMGPNTDDVPAMVLLPELLYRHNFGKPYMPERKWQAYTPEGVPLLAEWQDWHQEMAAAVPRLFSLPPGNIDWMPASRYRHVWPKMTAFGLPSFYDGRIRINLRGREAAGVVPPERYEAVRDEIVGVLRACRDPLRGGPVVAHVAFPEKHPSEIGPTEADLCVFWHGAPLGFVHPQHGRVGPIPYRRTGGHTGPWGFAYLAGEDFTPGDHGVTSSLDIVPTLIDLLGEGPLPVSGRSLRGRAAVAATA
jgi:predicted AlkP superfamily phosphohydrolase/phosphomutase